MNHTWQGYIQIKAYLSLDMWLSITLFLLHLQL